MLKGDISNRPSTELAVSLNSVIVDRLDKSFFGAGKLKVFLNTRNSEKLNMFYMKTEYSIVLIGVDYSPKEQKAIIEALDDSRILHSRTIFFGTYGEVYKWCKDHKLYYYVDDADEYHLVRPYSLSWTGAAWT